MKKILFVSATLSCALGAASVFAACPGDTFQVQQVALDANGVLTRSEMREVPAPDADESQKTVMANVVVDHFTLVQGDEIRLNAAPGMMDATVTLDVKLHAQKADQGGVISSTYEVHEIWTSGWGGKPTDKLSLVTVNSTYLGNGTVSKGCGTVEVKNLPNSTVPTKKR